MGIEAQYTIDIDHTSRLDTEIAEQIIAVLHGKGDIMPVIERRIAPLDRKKSSWVVISHARNITADELTKVIATCCNGREVKLEKARYI